MNPDGPMRLDQAVKRVGICMEMCPEYERVRRIVEEDLKAPEYVRIAQAILSTPWLRTIDRRELETQ